MQVFDNPPKESWSALVQRPAFELEFLESTVKNIITRVKSGGDKALRELTFQFDKVRLDNFRVSDQEINRAVQDLNSSLKQAVQTAAGNIEKFHRTQVTESKVVETMPGVTCWRKAIAMDKIGIYIPGGTAPLFSTVLMLSIPAKIAGCREVILCSPPDRDGNIHPAILFAAQLTGITKIFKAGGSQAIAAMAFGTESIPQVDKIFGPGNQFVTMAKQRAAREGVAIDLPAGPSEVLVWADKTAIPAFVAADLLSQAEHGTDSQVMLVASDRSIIEKIQQEILIQLSSLPRKGIAEQALQNSRAILLENENDAVNFINLYAPEHLIINTANADELAKQVVNAGSVFIGNYSPEAVGDYASGTNHTLPTNGFAKNYSGVSVESFQKFITFQKLSADGIKIIGPVVETMAEAEQLDGHKNAISIRLKYLSQKS